MLTGFFLLLGFAVPAGLVGWWTMRSDALLQRDALLAACGAVGAISGVAAVIVSAEGTDAVADRLSLSAAFLSAFAAIASLVLILRLAGGSRR